MTGKYTDEAPRPEMTGAQIVLKALRDNGVEHIFGYPGAAVLPIYDEIFKQRDIRHILVRHEQGAGHAAEGYARSTGKAGVMLVTSGPGVTNAVTPLQNAMADCVPIICLSGQVATGLIGSDAFQECDTVGITLSCTKTNRLVTDAGKLAATIHDAFQLALSGRPGPVLIDMPKDILVQSAYYTPPSAGSPPAGRGWRHETVRQWDEPGNPADEAKNTMISGRHAMERLHELTRVHAPYIATDIGRPHPWITQFKSAAHPDRLIIPAGFGTMGFGLPAAIGAQIAHPDSLVIDIADEWSVQTTMKELSTAIQYEAPVKVFILNSGSMERTGRMAAHAGNPARSAAAPDFVKLAEAYGAVGIRCAAPEDLDSAIGEMVAVKRPVLLDCRITG